MKAILILALLLSPASAASVAIPALSTSWQADPSTAGPASLSQVQSSTEYFFDLNDRTGLTPGRSMEIIVQFSPVVENWGSIWMGSFHLNQGPTSIVAQGRLELFAGSQSTFTTTLSSFQAEVPADSLGGPAVSDISGYILGSQPGDLRLVVPWDTDLTAAARLVPGYHAQQWRAHLLLARHRCRAGLPRRHGSAFRPQHPGAGASLAAFSHWHCSAGHPPPPPGPGLSRVRCRQPHHPTRQNM